MGAFFAPQKTGLSACIFFACGKKVYRFYPLRCSKMASMPFLSFRFLLRKNLGIYTAGLHAGGLLIKKCGIAVAPMNAPKLNNCVPALARAVRVRAKTALRFWPFGVFAERKLQTIRPSCYLLAIQRRYAARERRHTASKRRLMPDKACIQLI
jgi:hypothetical protein